jgi:hypothetical protein
MFLSFSILISSFAALHITVEMLQCGTETLLHVEYIVNEAKET